MKRHFCESMPAYRGLAVLRQHLNVRLRFDLIQEGPYFSVLNVRSAASMFGKKPLRLRPRTARNAFEGSLALARPSSWLIKQHTSMRVSQTGVSHLLSTRELCTTSFAHWSSDSITSKPARRRTGLICKSFTPGVPKDRMGVYRRVAEHVGVTRLDVQSAKARYGADMFAGICGDVVEALKAAGAGISDRSGPDALWDVVLIDEAQDLPASFFEMVYLITAPPKRIVWAYDELQNLGDYEMVSPSKLFGVDERQVSSGTAGSHTPCRSDRHNPARLLSELSMGAHDGPRIGFWSVPRAGSRTVF